MLNRRPGNRTYYRLAVVGFLVQSLLQVVFWSLRITGHRPSRPIEGLLLAAIVASLGYAIVLGVLAYRKAEKPAGD